MSSSQDKNHQPVITIIGLDWQGRSLGHALQQVKTSYEIMGHDREPALARAARDAGAIDRADWNLIAAVEAADLIFITEPVDQACETLAAIASEVRPGTLITDTAPAKAKVLRLAASVIPEGVSFIGGHPVLRPPSSHELEESAEMAAGRFDGASWCLCPLPNASEAAMRVLGNLVAAVGAKAFFVDPDEHDALQTGVGATPYLMALALLRRLGSSPSAEDLERLGGAALLDMLDLPSDLTAAYRTAAMEDAAGLEAWIGQAIEALQGLRHALVQGQEPFEALLDEAEEVRLRWLYPSAKGDDTSQALADISEQGSMRHMLFGRLGRRSEDEDSPR